MERSLSMSISFLLQQQDQEEVPDEIAEDPPRGDDPVPEVEVEVERSPVPDSSPPVPVSALHIQRSSLWSMFKSARGSSLLLWMLSVHWLLHRHRWTRGWPEPRPV